MAKSVKTINVENITSEQALDSILEELYDEGYEIVSQASKFLILEGPEKTEEKP